MATTTVSKINIKLGAQTAELESGFAQGERFAGKFADKITETAERVIASAAEMTVSLGRRLWDGVDQQIERIDEIAAAADKLGAGVAGLSRLAYASDRLEGSQEALIRGMEKMVENLGKAANSAEQARQRMAAGADTAEEWAAAMGDSVDGTTSAAMAFAQLGLNVEELMQLSTDEAFIRIADAISKLPTVAERSAKATAIFGGSAKEMLEVIEAGEAKMRALGAEADALGKTIGQDLADDAGAADDSTKQLNAAIDGLWNTITGEFAPALTRMNELLVEGIKWMREHYETTLKSATGVVIFVAGAIYAINAIATLVRSIQAITAALTAMNAAQIIALALKGPGGWAVLAGASLAAGAALGALIGTMVTFGDETEAALTTATESAEQLGTTVDASSRKVADATALAAIAAKEAKREMEEMQRAGEALAKSLRTPFEKAVDDIAEFDKLLKAGAIGWETYRRAVAKTAEEFREAAVDKHKFESPTYNRVAAVTQNTVAGFSAVQEAQNTQREVLAQAKAQAALQAEGNRLLADLVRATRDNRITVRKVPLP